MSVVIRNVPNPNDIPIFNNYTDVTVDEGRGDLSMAKTSRVGNYLHLKTEYFDGIQSSNNLINYDITRREVTKVINNVHIINDEQDLKEIDIVLLGRINTIFIPYRRNSFQYSVAVTGTHTEIFINDNNVEILLPHTDIVGRITTFVMCITPLQGTRKMMIIYNNMFKIFNVDNGEMTEMFEFGHNYIVHNTFYDVSFLSECVMFVTAPNIVGVDHSGIPFRIYKYKDGMFTLDVVIERGLPILLVNPLTENILHIIYMSQDVRTQAELIYSIRADRYMKINRSEQPFDWNEKDKLFTVCNPRPHGDDEEDISLRGVVRVYSLDSDLRRRVRETRVPSLRDMAALRIPVRQISSAGGVPDDLLDEFSDYLFIS